MMTKAKYCILLLCGLLMLMGWVACDPVSDYQTRPVKIYLTVQDELLTAGTLTVDVEPKDDRVYYYCGIIRASDFHWTNTSNFMNYMLDSLEMDYKRWRSTLLKTDIDYVASFESHCLSYGIDARTFSGLQPETNYIVYAFCVDPDTRTPMGELWMLHVTTRAYRQSELTFTYSIEHKDDGVWMTIEPSADEEPFLWDIVDEEDVEGHNLTPQGYVNQAAAIYHTTGQAPITTTYGFVHFNMSEMLSEGKTYCLMVVGYDGDFTTELYHQDITYSSELTDLAHQQFDVLLLRYAGEN